MITESKPTFEELVAELRATMERIKTYGRYGTGARVPIK